MRFAPGRWTIGSTMGSRFERSRHASFLERFADRRDAGRRLAHELERFRPERPVVVAIPRGGVPVAAEVARALSAPLDLVLVRKVGAPWQPEYALGAVAEGGVRVLGETTIAALDVGAADIEAALAGAEAELAERVGRYRPGAPAALDGRTVLLVDDGLATGHTARAAARSVRARGAARVVLAVPVAAPQSAETLAGEVDEVVALLAPPDLLAIGMWYDDFEPTSDEDVAALLALAATGPRDVRIPAGDGLELAADLTVPAGARGVVAFAHGSGSSRLSPRNRAVAAVLDESGMATLLLDLLVGDEELDRAKVFDIGLLATRLAAAGEWLRTQPSTAALPLGYFGASTGAAAALVAAADEGGRVGAVVSRGGRPDLAGDALGRVVSPTLLIVGGADREVLELNRLAQQRLRCPNRLEVVPGATHLFEELGALEQVAALASEWFLRHLS